MACLPTFLVRKLFVDIEALTQWLEQPHQKLKITYVTYLSIISTSKLIL